MADLARELETHRRVFARPWVGNLWLSFALALRGAGLPYRYELAQARAWRP